MKQEDPPSVHVWLVMMKAMQAVGRYALTGIEARGLGDSDFRVLEVLLHKGPLPVNTIGPKVNLTPGSISVAVERLHAKGLVSRVESADDRRVRIVALTAKGRKLIEPVFREHVAMLDQAFADLSPAERRRLEESLRKVGTRAALLFDEASSGKRPGGGDHRPTAAAD